MKRYRANHYPRGLYADSGNVMPEWDIHIEAEMAAAHCNFKHAYGCECWRHDPSVRAAVIDSHRRRLERMRSQPRPRLP